jgi:hypothetical protein
MMDARVPLFLSDRVQEQETQRGGATTGRLRGFVQGESQWCVILRCGAQAEATALPVYGDARRANNQIPPEGMRGCAGSQDDQRQEDASA